MKFMNTETFDKKILPLLIIGTILAGIILRFNGLPTRSLEYDEIWTISNYSATPFFSIFSDLSTPNNHPLNTLFIQWSIKGLGAEYFAIRLPVFLFGIATLILTALFTWNVTKRKDVTFFATACIAFNGYLIHYAQTARGYSIQAFFVLLTAVSLYFLAQSKRKVLFAILFLIAAVCSCLTITSGLVFVCALCGAFIVVRFRKMNFLTLCKENREFIIAALAFCLFAGLWYGMNYKAISAGQTFGTSVIHPWAFLKFVSEMLVKLILFPFVIIHAAVLFLKDHRQKKISLFALVFMGLVFLSALATKAGFDRVYLPMFTVAAVTSAMVIPDMFRCFKKENFTMPALILLAVLSVLPMSMTRKSQAKPDYIPLMQEISKDVGPECLVNFAVHDTYPMIYNCPESAQDYMKRLSYVPGLQGFLQVNSPDGISVYDVKSGNQTILKSPSGPIQKLTSADGTPMDLYRLEPLTPDKDPKGKMLLVTMTPHPDKMFYYFFKPMSASEPWYMANLFMTIKLTSPDRRFELKHGAYLCPAATHDAVYYLNITRQTGVNWRFYILK